MIKKVLFLLCLFIGYFATAQITSTEFRSKKFTLVKDTLQLETVSINSQRFTIFDQNKVQIPELEYQINFKTATLIIDAKKHPEITVEYYVFPDFLTKVYQTYNDSIIVPNTSNTQKLYSLTTNKNPYAIQVFEGLETKGSLIRGLTIGNNQNSVVNSSLDLTIQGKLSEDITIRANIYDTNIPLQQDGYSQSITDFDRICIELEHKNWRVKAGDLDLNNSESYFLQFSKKVSGLEVEARTENMNVLASGAIVRGRFSEFDFVGNEGNQGPYKIIGPNQETNLIIIGGSDVLFMNGTALQRGENKDYTIDYNTSEIRFNTTFPITSDMRFHLEYQYSERNYTRFVTYDKASYFSDRFQINGFFYNENDVKNQPLQQNLTNEQKQILADAGNDSDKMVSQSAYREPYSDTKILYKKTLVGAVENFEYSNDPSDELYNVTFTFVGTNKGDYTIDRNIAIGTIYKYVGVNAGNYNPIIRLAAPTKSQVVAVNSQYNPTKKTQLFTEVAISNTDANLFSDIDNNENKGIASKINWKQLLVDKKWQLSSDVTYEFIHQNFKTEQRFQSVEFHRDWNLINPQGNRHQVQTAFQLKKSEFTKLDYAFNYLEYSENYRGIQHFFSGKSTLKNTTFNASASLLNSTSIIEKNRFIKASTKIEHAFTNSWIGGFVRAESNERRSIVSNNLQGNSHQFKEYESYIGFGDSTAVFVKLGFNYRENDSIRTNAFSQINSRNTYYINSKIIENNNTNLSVFANYKTTKNSFTSDEKSLNTKIVYAQKIFDNFINTTTIYETSSGNIPRQEYVYIKTEPGMGYYTWIDYNNNGIKEFNEFEIAIFKDEADYLRVALPNLNYIKTQRARWVQTLTINPTQWNSKTGLKKTFSYFYNQSYFTIDNEQKRTQNTFNLNPFNIDETNLLGLNFSFKNSLFFNKNLQHYSFTYTYGTSKNKQFYSIGSQESNTLLQEISLQHSLSSFWLFDLTTGYTKNEVATENFANRNYEINAKNIAPKFTFLYNKNHRFSLFYQYKDKKNVLQSLEQLQQQNIGVSYFYLSAKKNQISTEINLFNNNFSGNQNSPVAYQMLEGLQAGKNYTWSILYQQKLNSFLDLNFNYLGRKSNNSPIIHTGSVQLRANF